jgi:hypothetical protein
VPTYSRRYSIEIRDANGVLLSATAYWTEKERRRAFAQIERLAGLPAVSFYAEPVLTPQSARTKPRRLPSQPLVED